MDKTLNRPGVSVVLPVYNAEGHLKEAIDSILSQTFGDFELIIINDGSNDRSDEIIRSYNDPRIVYKSRNNKGLARTLNEGIKLSRGKYIARQDADDISSKERLAQQVSYMESHPSVALLGSNYNVIDAKGRQLMVTDVFTRPNDLKLAEIASNQFGHGSAIIRKEILSDIGVYDSSKKAEDFDLWARISKKYEVANLKQPLYNWRSVGEGLSTHPEKLAHIDKSVREIRLKSFNHYLKNKRKYKLFYFRPFSTNGGIKKYLLMKNTTFRDLALLACYSGNRRQAPKLLLFALIYAPWIDKTYRQMLTIVFNKKAINSIPYDYI